MQVDDDANTVSSKPTSAPISGSSTPPHKVLKFPRFIIKSPKPKAFQAKVSSMFLSLPTPISNYLSS